MVGSSGSFAPAYRITLGFVICLVLLSEFYTGIEIYSDPDLARKKITSDFSLQVPIIAYVHVCKPLSQRSSYTEIHILHLLAVRH